MAEMIYRVPLFGWMLREVGKCCSQAEEEVFLQRYAATMPRTTLRYAIERFEEKKRQQYLKMKNQSINQQN